MIIQAVDALRQNSGITSPTMPQTITRSLGAGRYVRGQTTPSGNSWRAYLALYDATSSRPLYTVDGQIPLDLASATVAYSRLVESLLLRGASVDSAPTNAVTQRSLPAVQAFGRAQLALDDWNLNAADSSFQAAVAFDPEYAKANLWLAQVRAWRKQARTSWSPLRRESHRSERSTQSTRAVVS